jgi:hypothetical protein
MRVLLLSDIHSNLEALEACLAAAPSHDVVVNLGDIVGYGASPNEVIELSRRLGKFFVRGNHDKAVCGLIDIKDFNPVAALASQWTRDHLTWENLEWLRSLPQGPIRLEGLPDAQFVHGSPVDEDEYVVTGAADRGSYAGHFFRAHPSAGKLHVEWGSRHLHSSRVPDGRAS